MDQRDRQGNNLTKKHSTADESIELDDFRVTSDSGMKRLFTFESTLIDTKN